MNRAFTCHSAEALLSLTHYQEVCLADVACLSELECAVLDNYDSGYLYACCEFCVDLCRYVSGKLTIAVLVIAVYLI